MPIKQRFQIANKLRRQQVNVKAKKEKDSARRDLRLRRRREEAKDPSLREERRQKNVPVTIEAKRTWDNAVGDEEDVLGWAVDVDRIKRQKTEAEQNGEEEAEEAAVSEDDDVDSMLDSGSEDDENGRTSSKAKAPPARATSPAHSTATDLNLSPEFLRERFPASLFEPIEKPRILVTTSLNSCLHGEALVLASLFYPNATYIRRTSHAHGHKYSVREIASYAANRGYTSLVILMENFKQPAGLDIIHLPSGPHFHFTISNWVEGRKLPGHGNPTGHIPELILNNFKTPLGLLTAHLFRSLYNSRPQVEGRTVVTLHNQRDYIFVRRHRYVFREKRDSEKSVVGADGKEVKGVEDIKAGLQELGPRFTLKLRRIDRGIQFASGQEWVWKGKSEKVRTRFAM